MMRLLLFMNMFATMRKLDSYLPGGAYGPLRAQESWESWDKFCLYPRLFHNKTLKYTSTANKGFPYSVPKFHCCRFWRKCHLEKICHSEVLFKGKANPFVPYLYVPTPDDVKEIDFISRTF